MTYTIGAAMKSTLSLLEVESLVIEKIIKEAVKITA